MLDDDPMSEDGHFQLLGIVNPFYHGRGMQKRTSDCDPVV